MRGLLPCVVVTLTVALASPAAAGAVAQGAAPLEAGSEDAEPDTADPDAADPQPAGRSLEGPASDPDPGAGEAGERRAFRESIQITARKVEEDVQSVPLSVTVLTESQLADAQVETLDDLTLRAPNVNVFPFRSSTSTASIFIRGIGQDDNVFTVDPGVGLYVDGVYMPRAQAALLDVFDVERIELLRGPQGTLYGRNTIAGAINYITHGPSDERLVDLAATGGNYGRAELRGVFNAPLIEDRLWARLSYASLQLDGFEYNDFTDRQLGLQESSLGRLGLLWRGRDGVEAELRSDWLEQRPSPRIGALLRPQTTALDFPGLVAGERVTFPVSEDEFRVRSAIEERMAVDTWGLAATVSGAAGAALSWKSITGYRELEADSRFDIDATEARAADAFALQDHRQASQEIQLTYAPDDRLVAVGGLYYFWEDDDQFDGTDALAKGFSLDSQYAQQTESYAVYSQASYRLRPRLRLTGGLRYSYESKEFSRRSELHPADPTAPDFGLFGGFGHGAGARPPDRHFGNGVVQTDIRGVSNHWDAWTPRLGLELQWTPRAMAFVSVAGGFKSGGFNGRASERANPRQRDPYDPEYVWTYEAGAKTAWRDGRLVLNGTAFYNDYTDLQLASFVGADLDGDGADDTFLPLFTNAGRAVTAGFEVELSAVPAPSLELFATAGYTDAEFREYVERGVDVSDQRELAHAPDATASLGGVYTRRLGARHRLRLGADAGYQGARYLTVSNLEDLRQGGYTLVNAFAGHESADGRWRVTLGGRNLGDERYLVSGLDGTAPPFGLVTGFYGDPRTWTLTVGTRFGWSR